METPLGYGKSQFKKLERMNIRVYTGLDIIPIPTVRLKNKVIN